MPVPKNPSLPEFYVYALEASGVPFYLGIGRAGRGPYRISYVENLTRREASGKPVKWVLSNRVVAEFRKRGVKVMPVYLHSGLPRERALALERREISRLTKSGFVLANLQHNPCRPSSWKEVVQYVLSTSSRKPRKQTDSK